MLCLALRWLDIFCLSSKWLFSSEVCSDKKKIICVKLLCKDSIVPVGTLAPGHQPPQYWPTDQLPSLMLLPKHCCLGKSNYLKPWVKAITSINVDLNLYGATRPQWVNYTPGVLQGLMLFPVTLWLKEQHWASQCLQHIRWKIKGGTIESLSL